MLQGNFKLFCYDKNILKQLLERATGKALWNFHLFPITYLLLVPFHIHNLFSILLMRGLFLFDLFRLWKFFAVEGTCEGLSSGEITITIVVENWGNAASICSFGWYSHQHMMISETFAERENL